MKLWLGCGLLLTVLGDAAAGCVCLPIPKTPCEAAKDADVFRGKLVEAIPIIHAAAPGLPPPPPTGMRYRFQVLEDFSRSGRTSIELVRTGMTSCDGSYSVGTEYVVYARKSAAGQLRPEFKCGRTRPVKDADADLQYLRRGALVRTVLAGTLRTRLGPGSGQRIEARTAYASFETETDAEGLFQFLDLPTGRYILQAALHPELQKLEAEVKEGVCATANFPPAEFGF